MYKYISVIMCASVTCNVTPPFKENMITLTKKNKSETNYKPDGYFLYGSELRTEEIWGTWISIILKGRFVKATFVKLVKNKNEYSIYNKDFSTDSDSIVGINFSTDSDSIVVISNSPDKGIQFSHIVQTLVDICCKLTDQTALLDSLRSTITDALDWGIAEQDLTQNLYKYKTPFKNALTKDNLNENEVNQLLTQHATEMKLRGIMNPLGYNACEQLVNILLNFGYKYLSILKEIAVELRIDLYFPKESSSSANLDSMQPVGQGRDNMPTISKYWFYERLIGKDMINYTLGGLILKSGKNSFYPGNSGDGVFEPTSVRIALSLQDLILSSKLDLYVPECLIKIIRMMDMTYDIMPESSTVKNKLKACILGIISQADPWFTLFGEKNRTELKQIETKFNS